MAGKTWIKKATYQRTVFFTGTDLEIREAEQEEKEIFKKWTEAADSAADVTEVMDLLGKRICLIHPSTREEGKKQVTFFSDWDGNPYMHLTRTFEESIKEVSQKCLFSGCFVKNHYF